MAGSASFTLISKRMPPGLDVGDIRGFFGQFGRISAPTQVQIYPDGKRFGVVFSTLKECVNAFKACNDKPADKLFGIGQGSFQLYFGVDVKGYCRKSGIEVPITKHDPAAGAGSVSAKRAASLKAAALRKKMAGTDSSSGVIGVKRSVPTGPPGCSASQKTKATPQCDVTQPIAVPPPAKKLVRRLERRKPTSAHSEGVEALSRLVEGDNPVSSVPPRVGSTLRNIMDAGFSNAEAIIERCARAVVASASCVSVINETEFGTSGNKFYPPLPARIKKPDYEQDGLVDYYGDILRGYGLIEGGYNNRAKAYKDETRAHADEMRAITSLLFLLPRTKSDNEMFFSKRAISYLSESEEEEASSKQCFVDETLDLFYHNPDKRTDVNTLVAQPVSNQSAVIYPWVQLTELGGPFKRK